MLALRFGSLETSFAYFRALTTIVFRWAASVLGCSCFVLATGFTYGQPSATVVVTGLKQPYSIAVDTGGNLYIADQACTVGLGDCNLYKETLSSGTYTPSIVDSFTSAAPPEGVAVDASGNVYIGVFGIGLYKETPSGKTYTRALVGCTDNAILGVAVDSNGNIYYQSSGHVFKETSSSSCASVIQVAGGGASTNLVDFNVATDSCGDVYVHQMASPAFVWKETPIVSGYTQSDVMGTSTINGMAVDNKGNVYVSTGSGSVYMALPSTPFYAPTVIQSGLVAAGGVAVDSVGNVYSVDQGQNRVWKVTPSKPLGPAGPCPPTSASGNPTPKS